MLSLNTRNGKYKDVYSALCSELEMMFPGDKIKMAFILTGTVRLGRQIFLTIKIIFLLIVRAYSLKVTLQI